MFKKLFPRQDNFFILFKQTGEEFAAAAKEFQNMINDLPHATQHAAIIAQYESRADVLTLQTFELLHKTFITPFDRYDIHQLTGRLDDLIDSLNRTAQRIAFYQLAEMPKEFHMLADLLVKAAFAIKNAVSKLDALKNHADILNICIELNTIENKADEICLISMADLFKNETDFKQLLKMKEIYEHVVHVIESCQDLGNVIQGIMLEYS